MVLHRARFILQQASLLSNQLSDGVVWGNNELGLQESTLPVEISSRELDPPLTSYAPETRYRSLYTFVSRRRRQNQSVLISHVLHLGPNALSRMTKVHCTREPVRSRRQLNRFDKALFGYLTVVAAMAHLESAWTPLDVLNSKES